MTSLGHDMSRRAATVAGRLRLLQADFADGSREEREQFVAEEIERELSSLVPDERQAFLDELGEWFPTWDARVDFSPDADATAAQAPTDARELEDPSFLVSRLIALAPSLTDLERNALIDRLRAVGLAPAAATEWPEAPAETVRSKLKLKPTADIDAGRALELIAIMTELVLSLDQLVWNTWRTIASRSDIRRTGNLETTMAKFVAGDPDVPRGAVMQDVAKLRSLVAALIAAISQAGRQFAQSHLAKFSPSEIEALASMEGGGLLVSKEVKCWRKYLELAGTMDEIALERDLMEAVAGYAESLIKGLGR